MSEQPSVVITGAGAGIGAATAALLSERGYEVIVTDVDERAAQSTAASLGCHAEHLDVTDPAAARSVAERVLKRCGRLDAWVSNAGVSKMAPFRSISSSDLDHTLAVNAKGPFICGQAAAEAMIAGGRGGAIVNVASMAGKQGKIPFLADYIASKFAVVGLTQAMAFELAEFNIRVNSICPGYVTTGMQDRELSWEAKLRHVNSEAVKHLYLADTPLRRLESPEDVARGIAFLLSDEASFITGEALAVNGGAFMD